MSSKPIPFLTEPQVESLKTVVNQLFQQGIDTSRLATELLLLGIGFAEQGNVTPKDFSAMASDIVDGDPVLKSNGKVISIKRSPTFPKIKFLTTPQAKQINKAASDLFDQNVRSDAIAHGLTALAVEFASMARITPGEFLQLVDLCVAEAKDDGDRTIRRTGSKHSPKEWTGEAYEYWHN